MNVAINLIMNYSDGEAIDSCQVVDSSVTGFDNISDKSIGLKYSRR